LADQFVCVRIQSMNGVNIDLFQFERDLTWMAFFMDSNDRFYARYGGRDASHAESHLSRDSLLRTMRDVLELHRSNAVQAGRYEPTAGTPRTPEEIPPMKRMLDRRKENKCIHCHDVKVAELRHLQTQGQFSRGLVFTYPTPAAVGIQLDRDSQSTVTSVIAESPAAAAGAKPGDQLLEADGQRILTMADLSRVLERSGSDATLPLKVQREGRMVSLQLKLTGNWRQSEDPSWRESLHVAGPNGGFWGERIQPAERGKLGLPADKMAVRVTFIWGDHARRAGLKVGDLVVALDGNRLDWGIRQLHAHLNLHRNYGDTVPLVVSRQAQELTLHMKLPAQPDAD
jgi:hypothetical protein